MTLVAADVNDNFSNGGNSWQMPREDLLTPLEHVHEFIYDSNINASGAYHDHPLGISWSYFTVL